MDWVLSTLCWRAVALPEFVDKVQWVMALPKLIGEVFVIVRHWLEFRGVDGIKI